MGNVQDDKVKGKIEVVRVEENKYLFESQMWQEFTAYELLERLHILRMKVAQCEEQILNFQKEADRYRESIAKIVALETVALEESKKHQPSFFREALNENKDLPQGDLPKEWN